MAEDKIESLFSEAALAQMQDVVDLCNKIVDAKAKMAAAGSSFMDISEIQNEVKNVADLNNTTTNYAKTVKETQFNVNELTNAQKQVSNITQKLVETMSGANNELILQKQKLSEATAEQKAKIQAENVEIGSLNQLRASLKSMSAEYNAMGEAQRINTDAGKQLTASLAETKQKITDAEFAVKNFTGNVGNYAGSLLGVKEKMALLKTEMSTMDMGSKEFKAAEQQIFSYNTQLRNANHEMKGLTEEQISRKLTRLVAGLGQMGAAAMLAFGGSDKDAEKFKKNITDSMSLFMGLEGGLKAVTAAQDLFRVAKTYFVAETVAETAATVVQTGATEGAAVAQVALNAAMYANPIGAIILAVAALAAGAAFLATQIVQANNVMDNFYKDMDKVETKGLEEYENELDKLDKKLKLADNEKQYALGKITELQYESFKQQIELGQESSDDIIRISLATSKTEVELKQVAADKIKTINNNSDLHADLVEKIKTERAITDETEKEIKEVIKKFIEAN